MLKVNVCEILPDKMHLFPKLRGKFWSCPFQFFWRGWTETHPEPTLDPLKSVVKVIVCFPRSGKFSSAWSRRIPFIHKIFKALECQF